MGVFLVDDMTESIVDFNQATKCSSAKYLKYYSSLEPLPDTDTVYVGNESQEEDYPSML